jgi:hypothetical protein
MTFQFITTRCNLVSDLPCVGTALQTVSCFSIMLNKYNGSSPVACPQDKPFDLVHDDVQSGARLHWSRHIRYVQNAILDVDHYNGFAFHAAVVAGTLRGIDVMHAGSPWNIDRDEHPRRVSSSYASRFCGFRVFGRQSRQNPISGTVSRWTVFEA